MTLYEGVTVLISATLAAMQGCQLQLSTDACFWLLGRL